MKENKSNEGNLIAQIIIGLLFIALFVIIARKYLVPPQQTLNKPLDDLFSQFTDSIDTNVALGYKAIDNKKIDSANYYVVRARIFWEAEGIVLLKIKSTNGKPE